MTDMQAFHSMLHQEQETPNSYILALIKLTKASLEKLEALDGAPSWDPWFASEEQ